MCDHLVNNEQVDKSFQIENRLRRINNQLSRETWLYSPPQLSPVHHGEKSTVLANLLHSSLDMPKLDLLDLETFINLPASVVNPLEVPHLIEQSTPIQNAATLADISSQDSINGMRPAQAESSGVFYRPKAQKLKLEMELFGDLAGYCHPTRMMAAKSFQNIVDELNTPVFEKAPFDYDRACNSTGLLDVVTSIEDPFNFKIKTELSSIDNVNIEDNLMIKDDNLAFKEGESKDIKSMMPSDINMNLGRPVNNYIVISSEGISTNSSNVFTTPNNSEYEDIYHNPSDTITPMYKELVEDDEYLPTVNNCSDIFFNNSSNSYGIDVGTENSNSQIDDSPSNQYIVLQTAPFDTPDNSRSASEFSDSVSPTLKLQIDKKYKSTDVIDTPDVINTIDAIENERGFNILNFITDEDIHTAAPALSTINIPTISTFIPPQSTSHKTKYTLKRKLTRDDDDEDYEPPVPAKKKSVGRKTIKIQPQAVHYDSDDSTDDEEVIQSTRKGRPPQRNISISSEDYGDGKYRVMRDKNNEASRKSRLKRKLKEVAKEEEMTGLEDRNTKLKAQVSELERTVNNFRNNLMQILLKK